jgi:hypothetical protein
MLGSIVHGHGGEVAGGFHLTRERSPWHDHFLVPVLRTVLEGALKKVEHGPFSTHAGRL